jgi:hypothetical protein
VQLLKCMKKFLIFDQKIFAVTFLYLPETPKVKVKVAAQR